MDVEPTPNAPNAAPPTRHGLKDTSADVERAVIEGYRRMTPEEKLRRVFDLNAGLEALATARIRSRYGADLSERELRLRLAALRVDRETMIRAFGWDPDEHGY